MIINTYFTILLKIDHVQLFIGKRLSQHVFNFHNVHEMKQDITNIQL